MYIKPFTRVGYAPPVWKRDSCQRIEEIIQNAGTTPGQFNQLRNVNTVRWASRNITTQPGDIDDRNSDVIAVVINAGKNMF